MSESQIPLVSVIITTLRRPNVVTQAIESVLRQTYSSFELLVIVDGPDPATVDRLSTLSDPRLRVVVLPENVGLGEARNAGARESKGEWLAFLDDDDEWFPKKLEIQLGSALRYGDDVNFVASRFEERTANGVRIRPKFFPATGEHWSESFYCHKVLLLPSTFLIKRQFMLEFPFRFRRHEDADWLLRAQTAGVMKPLWVEESLTIYHCESTKNRISTHVEWKSRYQWYLDNPTLITPKALPYYIAMLCIPEAQNSPSPLRACAFLWKEAATRGNLSIKALAYLAMTTFSSRTWRSKLREKSPVLQRRTSLRNTNEGGR